MGCLPLFHKWSDWAQVPGKCQEQQVCAKCGNTKERDAHKMTDWAMIPGQCRKERHCSNPWCDKHEEQQTSHKWGEWAYYEDGCCTQKRVCTVCGETEYREQCPEVKDQIPLDGECRVIEICPRCGLESTYSVEHAWGAPSAYRNMLSGRVTRNTNKVLKMKNEGASEAALNIVRAQMEEDKAAIKTCPADWQGRICTKCGAIQRVGKR